MVAPNTSPSNTPPITIEQANRLLREIDLMTAAEALSNAALSDAAINAFVKLGGSDYAIFNELVKRFDELAGVKRDEETGEVIG